MAFRKWVVAPAFLVLVVGAGLAGFSASAAQEDDGPFASYREALGVIKREYTATPVDNKKANELTESAIRGMLFSLNDPFTSFLDRDEWLQMQQTTRGDFEGIGAVLEAFGEDVRIKQPIVDTPAYKAGLKSGDTIMSVAQHDSASGKPLKTEPTLGKDINDVVKLIKGPKGSVVTLTVIRKGSTKPLSFTMRRAHIEPPIVQYWMEDNQNKIGHILLNEFNEKSDEQFDKAMADLEHQGMKALVFDLRYNPGGLLNVAVDIGSRFTDGRPVVLIQDKHGVRQSLPERPEGQRHKHYPTVVLINEFSASASEIVSGAIKDYGLATVVGEHSFGKGLVQTLIPLSDGGALRLTTAKYFTPNGNDISNKYDDEHRPIFGTGGIKPDVVVEQSKDWMDQDFTDKEHDTQLHKALDILRTKLASAK